jgi:hypothetical protein
MNLKPSFQRVGKNGKYNPSQSEKNFGGHALCVVGYDNINKEFEIINSWGTDWGNNGFFNISYDNYGKYCNEAYQFSLKPTNIADNQLTGSFQLLKYSPSDANSFIDINPFLSSDHFYYLNAMIQKDDYFRIRASGLVKDTYVYIFTIKPDNTSELLFPLNYNSNSQVKDIPLITSNSVSIELPENKENAYSADIIGEDVLVILYSKKRLENLDYVVEQSVNNKSDIWGWLKRYFKDDLIRQEDIEYSPYNMKVTSKKYINGYVAALILKVKVK